MTDYLDDARKHYREAVDMLNASDYIARHGFDGVMALLKMAEVALLIGAVQPVEPKPVMTEIEYCRSRDPERPHQLCRRQVLHIGGHNDGNGRAW